MSRVTIPAGFEWIRAGRVQALVRADVRDWLVPLLRAARGQWAGYDTRPLHGGRGGARIVPAHGAVVRPYRRGGLPGRLLHDAYFGRNPRPFRELSVTAMLHDRGAPVAEVYGAAVEWIVPGCYRGWLATHYIEGARTLWEWLSSAPPAAERAAPLRNIGRALRRLHACGARHPDLNANNILLHGSSDVVFIDFDRASIAPAAVAGAADLDRLWRSLRKLDPQSRHVAAPDFELLRAAYGAETACA